MFEDFPCKRTNRLKVKKLAWKLLLYTGHSLLLPVHWTPAILTLVIKLILIDLKKQGASAETVENYGDYYFRNYDIPEKDKKTV